MDSIYCFEAHEYAFYRKHSIIHNSVGFSIENNAIDNINNLSSPLFTDCNDHHILADPENANTTQLANVRGISVDATW